MQLTTTKNVGLLYVFVNPAVRFLESVTDSEIKKIYLKAQRCTKSFQVYDCFRVAHLPMKIEKCLQNFDCSKRSGLKVCLGGVGLRGSCLKAT